MLNYTHMVDKVAEKDEPMGDITQKEVSRSYELIDFILDSYNKTSG